MLSRAAIRELAQFRNNEGWALSFYYQPHTPESKSHRGEAIVAKDLLRSALRELPKANHVTNGRRAALNRLLEFTSNLQAGRLRAKAVFAAAPDFWREFDLPPQLPDTQLFLGHSFHLKPLAMLLGVQPRLGVILVDRQRARLFDLRLDELTESGELFQRLPRGHSDGYAGYDAGHAERHIEERALRSLKHVADVLKQQAEHGLWEKLIVGCHQSFWREFQALLHPYVKQRVVGHFTCDVAAAKPEEIRVAASQMFQDFVENRRKELVTEVIANAKSHTRGAIGLRQVLRAVETGQAQTILMAENYSAHAVQCSACGRIDSHIVRYCALCGKQTRTLEDVSDALVALAVTRDIELFYVKDNPELDRVGNIAALLRFRVREESMGAAVGAGRSARRITQIAL
jgi:hypothetical protein